MRYTDSEDEREIRISTGTTDESEAVEHKKQLEANLLLGIDAKPRKRVRGGAAMAWDVFEHTRIALDGIQQMSQWQRNSEMSALPCCVLGPTSRRDAWRITSGFWSPNKA